MAMLTAPKDVGSHGNATNICHRNQLRGLHSAQIPSQLPRCKKCFPLHLAIVSRWQSLVINISSCHTTFDSAVAASKRRIKLFIHAPMAIIVAIVATTRLWRPSLNLRHLHNDNNRILYGFLRPLYRVSVQLVFFLHFHPGAIYRR